MQRQRYLLVVMIGLIVASLFGADGVNFSGTWILDESKVDASAEGPRMSADKIVIKQEDNSFSTDRYLSNEMMGDFTISTKTTLDGKESVNEEQFGTRKSTASWSEDKKALTINSTLNMNFNGQEMEMKSTEVWTLENDDTVLNLKTTSDSPMGTRENVSYYMKSQ